MNAVLGGEVEEVLLLVAHHHGDVGYAALEELADLPLDEHLLVHAQHALGALVGERDEAAREARGHDDSVVHAVGLERFDPALGDAAGVQEAPLGAGAHSGGGSLTGESGYLGERLCGRLLTGFGERAEDNELVSRDCHDRSFLPFPDECLTLALFQIRCTWWVRGLVDFLFDMRAELHTMTCWSTASWEEVHGKPGRQAALHQTQHDLELGGLVDLSWLSVAHHCPCGSLVAKL